MIKLHRYQRYKEQPRSFVIEIIYDQDYVTRTHDQKRCKAIIDEYTKRKNKQRSRET